MTHRFTAETAGTVVVAAGPGVNVRKGGLLLMNLGCIPSGVVGVSATYVGKHKL